jgi:hypothetical protein
MAQLFGTNYKLLQTQSRMLDVPLHPMLTGTGGYGKTFDIDRLNRAIANAEDLFKPAGRSSVQGAPAWRLKLLISTRERDDGPLPAHVPMWDNFKNSWPDVGRFAVGMERIKSDGAKWIINRTSGLAAWAEAGAPSSSRSSRTLDITYFYG